jgi:hypothetical protein
VHELIPIGPLRVAVRLPSGLKGGVASLVTGQAVPATVAEGWVRFEVGTIADHDVLVLT